MDLILTGRMMEAAEAERSGLVARIAPAGKALDMTQVGPVLGFDARISGSHDPAIIAGAEVVVVTAGFPRKPGMDRMELLQKNVGIVAGVAKAAAPS